MPVMDGVTFLSHIRRREDTELIPFILLTARSSDEDKVDGLLLGADGPSLHLDDRAAVSSLSRLTAARRLPLDQTT